MDSKVEKNSNAKVNKSGRKNEEKKKIETENTDKALDEVCRQVSKLAVDEVASGSGSSTDSEDLVNAINYNTITSLAALKDIIQGDNNDTPETDSFFQHYFMNHCNNLSSRNSNSPFPFTERRRLSQCREEDEEDEKKESAPQPSTVSSVACSEDASQESIDVLKKECNLVVENDEQVDLVSKKQLSTDDVPPYDQEPPKRTIMGAKHKFLVTTAKHPPASLERVLRSQVHNAHTVHFGTKGAEEQRPSVRSIFSGQNLHRDKNYFDSSLIEIRSTVDGLPTSSEDIWVKRIDETKDKLSKDETKPSVFETATLAKEDKGEKIKEPKRVRSGTWDSQTLRNEKDTVKKAFLRKEKERRSSDERRHKREQRLDAAITRSSQSVGERKRRGSADDGQPHYMYQQTIHGTSGVSRRPALFDIFKSRPRGDAKKPPSIMQQVKAAVQSMTKSGTGVGKEPLKGETLAAEESKSNAATNSAVTTTTKIKDGSAHPHPGSDSRYYHTLTVSESRRPSAMAKVMEMFRGRASIPGQTMLIESVEKRRVRANAHQQHLSGGEFKILFLRYMF
ncbi:unnamed protein product [Parnassius apollo]|uniref:(apollo) hypothetical protein n=1 Tax=Parnassius apollo TaxID=110799 RepID=A0A8S3WIH5_PARAO|nr:unnamed protein product [Parnassius apollo]